MKASLFGLLLLTVCAAGNAQQDLSAQLPGAADHGGPRGKPIETQLIRASSKKFDLRKLPHEKPKQQDRPEFEEPDLNPIELPGGPQPSAPAIPGPSAPAPAPNAVYEGLDRFNWGAGSPPDTNGDVGPTYYIETVNTSIGVYTKADGVQQAAFTFNTFMSQGAFGNLCDTNNFGDPVVLYDTFEDRWVITDFAFKLDPTNTFVVAPAYQCFAVSKSGDPLTGGWNFYSRLISDNLDDYPKFGIWPDGLYMSANMFSFGASSAFQGARAWAFNKAQMYAGSATVQVVQFDVGGGDFTVIPSNARLQTGTPPTGTPNYFVSTWQFLNALTVYKFHVDWNSISLSTFTGPDTPLAATSWPNAAVANVPQSGTATLLDALQIRAMVQNQYTNFSGVESLWVPHTVRRANTTGFAAPRWYQANVTGGTVAANLPQAATWDPDGANVTHRWMPSLAVDRAGDMAMGYSTSSSTTFPSIAYAGRLAADPINTFSQTEQTFFTGTGPQTGSTRWGDYSSMTLDTDGCTFWYASEYANPADQTSNHRWLTKFGNFGPFPGCTPVGAGGTVSGTVTQTPGGAPLSGATVALGSRTTTTDGSGFYSFTSIPAGTYPTISASMPGFGSASASSIVVTDSSTTTQNFSLGSAAISGCFTDTTQADFLTGVATNLDLNTSPGDVTLSNAPVIDQANTAGTTTGTGFGTPNWTGQTFIAGVSGQLVKADVQLFCSGCTGTTPNLTLSVRATSAGLPTGADLASGTIPGFSSGAIGTYTVAFAAPATLSSGTQYALILRPVAAPSAGGYFWIRSSPGTYANGSRVLSADSGTTWSADTTRDFNFHTYMQAGYAASGDLVSSTKDANPAAGSTPIWTTLSWNDSAPANTALQFQVAASNSAFGPFNFVGPDGTAGTFFTTSGASLSQFNGKRYLQYRSYLTTSDSAVTPTMNDATMCFADVGPTTTTLTSDTNPSVFGQNVTFTATVSANYGTPTGTVTFKDGGTPIGSAPLSSGAATLMTSALAVGNHTITADYAGDGTYTASTASLDTNPQVVNPADSSTAVTSDQNPSVFGQTVTFTATVSANSPGSGTPTGTVTFYDGLTSIGSAPLSGGVATLMTSSLALGSHAINASYGGDAGFNSSSGNLDTTPQVVNQAATSTAVTSSLNPSNFGQSVAFTATVSAVAPGSGTPTGTVTFRSGSTVLGSPVTLDGSAQAVFTISTLPVGNNSITAHYNGDSDFTVSTGTLTGNPQVVLGSILGLSVDDSHLFARYNMVLDYLVTLSNSGNATANGVSVTSTASADLDGGNATWICTNGGSGATCTASGSGQFADTATLPAGRSLTWQVTIPVLAGTASSGNATDTTISFTVHAAGAADASDVDKLVIFRDGFNVIGADGTRAFTPGPDAVGVIAGNSSQVFKVPAPAGNAIEDVLTLRAGSVQAHVQSVTFGATTWVRVLADNGGLQTASAWARAKVGDTLTIGSVTGSTQRMILLEGADQSLMTPLASPAQ